MFTSRLFKWSERKGKIGSKKTPLFPLPWKNLPRNRKGSTGICSCCSHSTRRRYWVVLPLWSQPSNTIRAPLPAILKPNLHSNPPNLQRSFFSEVQYRLSTSHDLLLFAGKILKTFLRHIQQLEWLNWMKNMEELMDGWINLLLDKHMYYYYMLLEWLIDLKIDWIKKSIGWQMIILIHNFICYYFSFV